MTAEEQYIPGFNVQDMINNVVKKYLKKLSKDGEQVIYDAPVYENVNGLWYIYFTSKYAGFDNFQTKRYYQLVMGFCCEEEYFMDCNVIDDDKNYTIDQLKANFKHYLKILLAKCEPAEVAN